MDKFNTVIKGYWSVVESNTNPTSNAEFGCSHITINNNISPRLSSSLTSVGISPIVAAMYANVPATHNSYGVSGLNFGTLTDPYKGGFNITDYRLYDANGYDRGKLPGVYYIKQTLNKGIGNFEIIDGTGDLAGRKLLSLYTQGNINYFYTLPSSMNSAIMLFDITGPWEY